MPENPHIEGGELDNAATNIDPKVDITIDPSTQQYADAPEAVIAGIKAGGPLALQQAKQGLGPLLAGLQFAAGAFPGGSAGINTAIGLINAVSAKI